MRPVTSNCGKRVVGYLTQWGASEVTEQQLRRLTHVIYVFVVSQKNGTITLDNETPNDRFYSVKDMILSTNSSVKMMISIGGHRKNRRFPLMISDTKRRKTLIDSLASFIVEHDLDGVDIYWVWSTNIDKMNHSSFLLELRDKLNDLKVQRKRTENYVISMIVPPFIDLLRNGYDLKEIIKHVDFLNVLTYDYHLNANRTGPNSPIYGDVETSMRLWDT
uniref:Glyco_18 domain-containing protein n=1 Tax=Caenorhabditis tropicalis TaxID=1561998 RepID=A0A1I7T6C1_9PELO